MTDSTIKQTKIEYSLELLSERYNYNHWLFNNIRPYVGHNILEVGAGIGNITDFIMFKHRLTLLEIDANFVEYLKNKYSFRKDDSLKVIKADISNLENTSLKNESFDTVICLNVLEHIEKDKKVIENFEAILEEKGKLILIVPALQFIYGSMDKKFGHIRRYSRKTLRKLLEGTSLKIKKIHYINFLGALGWFVSGKILKRATLPIRQTILFDNLVPFISVFEKLFKPPIGQSILLVAEKAEKPTA